MEELSRLELQLLLISCRAASSHEEVSRLGLDWEGVPGEGSTSGFFGDTVLLIVVSEPNLVIEHGPCLERDHRLSFVDRLADQFRFGIF